MTLIIGMEATADDRMIDGLVSRLMRSGHHLTPSSVDKIHAIISSNEPDTRIETGSQTEAAKAIKERIDREQ